MNPGDPRLEASRANILRRVRQATSATEAVDPPDGFPSFPKVPDLIDRFRRELEAVDGRFLDLRQADAARWREVLSEVVSLAEAEESVWESPDLLERFAIPCAENSLQAFQDSGRAAVRHPDGEVEVPLHFEGRPGGRRFLAEIRLSVSGAACGIADSGTVVHRVGAGKGRLLSVLPPCHLILLSARTLLPDSRSFFDECDPAERGSAMTLITGPSRTADIEKVLVTGVHGPGMWFVALCD